MEASKFSMVEIERVSAGDGILDTLMFIMPGLDFKQACWSEYGLNKAVFHIFLI